MGVVMQPLHVSRAPTAFFWYPGRSHGFLRVHDGVPGQLAVVLAAFVRRIDSTVCPIRHEAGVFLQVSLACACPIFGPLVAFAG